MENVTQFAHAAVYHIEALGYCGAHDVGLW